jgi:hypothetical protein
MSLACGSAAVVGQRATYTQGSERSVESLRWPIGHLNDICIARSVCCVNSKYATKPQWLFYGVAELIHRCFLGVFPIGMI